MKSWTTMRLILVSVGAVLVIQAYVTLNNRELRPGYTLQLAASSENADSAPGAEERKPNHYASGVRPVALLPSGGATLDEGEPQIINIGEPLDPNNPSSWWLPHRVEVIIVGQPMDPGDPSTWPQSDSTEVINIGEPMDPGDLSTWPQSDSTEVINIGEPMDPEDPYTWPQSQSTEVINIGEPLDPDDPYTWPR